MNKFFRFYVKNIISNTYKSSNLFFYLFLVSFPFFFSLSLFFIKYIILHESYFHEMYYKVYHVRKIKV